ncbi:uncharacterized protein LOC131632401 [Vicia villosa]|uniref:uncharacterized protein LOC131632401 n=1 Tax=Vicia villosa TaxID=3911 RepID=UPI00273B6D62|nr:uncharacterized protein LOC131632401 [Vicia villosa]
MNTKTMRLPPRRVLTPSTTTSTKRKERDDPFERPKPIPATTSKLPKSDKPISRLGSEPITSPTTTSTTTASRGLEPKPMPSNQLLAGYLAHEYLTKGTLLGQPWVPPKGKSKEEDDGVDEGEPTATTTAAAAEEACPSPEIKMERERYVEVTGLLKSGGTHLHGVVNPTQLARFLHL